MIICSSFSRVIFGGGRGDSMPCRTNSTRAFYRMIGMNSVFTLKLHCTYKFNSDSGVAVHPSLQMPLFSIASSPRWRGFLLATQPKLLSCPASRFGVSKELYHLHKFLCLDTRSGSHYCDCNKPGNNLEIFSY
jgi:hypothetical protein